MSKTLFEKRKPLGWPSIKPQGSKMRVWNGSIIINGDHAPDNGHIINTCYKIACQEILFKK